MYKQIPEQTFYFLGGLLYHLKDPNKSSFLKETNML